MTAQASSGSTTQMPAALLTHAAEAMAYSVSQPQVVPAHLQRATADVDQGVGLVDQPLDVHQAQASLAGDGPVSVVDRQHDLHGVHQAQVPAARADQPLDFHPTQANLAGDAPQSVVHRQHDLHGVQHAQVPATRPDVQPAVPGAYDHTDVTQRDPSAGSQSKVPGAHTAPREGDASKQVSGGGEPDWDRLTAIMRAHEEEPVIAPGQVATDANDAPDARPSRAVQSMADSAGDDHPGSHAASISIGKSGGQQSAVNDAGSIVLSKPDFWGRATERSPDGSAPTLSGSESVRAQAVQDSARTGFSTDVVARVPDSTPETRDKAPAGRSSAADGLDWERLTAIMRAHERKNASFAASAASDAHELSVGDPHASESAVATTGEDNTVEDHVSHDKVGKEGTRFGAGGAADIDVMTGVDAGAEAAAGMRDAVLADISRVQADAVAGSSRPDLNTNQRPAGSTAPDMDVVMMLRQTPTAKRTDSAVHVIPARRPRPPEGNTRASAALLRQPLPAKPEATAAAPVIRTVPTDIGELPVDLWSLIGEEAPGSHPSTAGQPNSQFAGDGKEVQLSPEGMEPHAEQGTIPSVGEAAWQAKMAAGDGQSGLLAVPTLPDVDLGIPSRPSPAEQGGGVWHDRGHGASAQRLNMAGVAQAPHTERVQRQPVDVATALMRDSSTTNGSSSPVPVAPPSTGPLEVEPMSQAASSTPDVQELARQVYGEVRRRLAVERERLG